MSLPVATTISGMESLDVLKQNLQVARGFEAMNESERSSLEARVKAYAADGRYELFKSTKKYDGDVGRVQHGFPPASELPA